MVPDLSEIIATYYAEIPPCVYLQKDVNLITYAFVKECHHAASASILSHSTRLMLMTKSFRRDLTVGEYLDWNILKTEDDICFYV